MNVNLVSPVENGNNFVVRFKEDIIIPERSKVYLNFASFSRENDVELYEDQDIKLLVKNDDIRPSLLPTAPFIENTLFHPTHFTIPKGTYNYQKLYTLITAGINGILQNPANPTDMSMYRAVSIADIDNTDAQITAGQVSFSLGLMKANITTVPHRDMTIDTANFVNADTDTDTCAYQKNSANATVNSGLKQQNVVGAGAFDPSASGYTLNVQDRTVGTYTGQQLQGGTGAGATINFSTKIEGLINGNDNSFVAGFDASGANTANKSVGTYDDVPLVGGTGSGATVSFQVDGTGAILRSSILIIDSGDIAGAQYAVDDLLTISNSVGTPSPTGGTQDTVLKVSDLRTVIDFQTIRINAQGNNYTALDVLTISNTTPNAIGGASATTHDTIQVVNLQPSAGLPYFDNYALSTRHYWHMGYNDNTPYDNTNMIRFETRKSATDMLADNGRLAIGLGSSEIALGINASNGAYPLNSGSRTGGLNATTSDGTSKNPQYLPLDSAGSAKHLVGYAMVEIDATRITPTLKVFMPQKANGTWALNGINTWDSCNQPITAMKNVFNINLANITGYDVSNTFKGGIQTYYDHQDLDNERLYFRVLNLNKSINGNEPITNDMVIYDSKTGINVAFFPDTFFKATDNTKIDYGTTSGFPIADFATTLQSNQGSGNKTVGQHDNINITTTTGTGAGLIISFAVSADGHINFASLVVNNAGDGYKVGDQITIPNDQGVGGTADSKLKILVLDSVAGGNRINSQIPFNVICSALTQGDGFEHITAPFFTKHDNKPLSMVYKYEIEGDEEISRYLNLHTADDRIQGHSDFLHPNTGDAMNPNLIHLEGMNLDWRNESYSISLKELPIKNYKNSEKKSQGGFGKTILANCPVPFSDAQSYATKSKQMITATYKPNYQVISNLYNQASATNHFSVEIRKLASDKPANEIKKSVVNFTIMPPDDYKGNINSVDLISNQ